MYIVTRRRASVIKVDMAYVGVCISRYLKEGWFGLHINGLGLLAIYNSYTTREQKNKAILTLHCYASGAAQQTSQNSVLWITLAT